jgi:signal transduction histidine kinase
VDVDSKQTIDPLLQAALDALTAHVAVLDPQGAIVAVNRAWRRFGRANHLQLPNFGIGTNYLLASSGGASASPDIAEQLREVLLGRCAGFSHQYCCAGPNGERWFEMQVRSVGKSTSRWTFVAHEDITELKEAESGLRELAEQLARSREVERRHLARELHDSTGQELLVIGLNLSQLGKLLGSRDRRGRQLLGEASNALKRAQLQLRTMSYLLHPPAIGETGLSDALSTFVKGFQRRTGIRVRFATNFTGRSGEQVERALQGIVQEALINVYRHSESRTARVQLKSIGDRLELRIADSGRWASGEEGVGIASMRERIREIGGSLKISSTLRGTLLHAVAPNPLSPSPAHTVIPHRAKGERSPRGAPVDRRN